MQRGSYYWFRESFLKMELEFAKLTLGSADLADAPTMTAISRPMPYGQEAAAIDKNSRTGLQLRP
jgi:hypothetical protein